MPFYDEQMELNKSVDLLVNELSQHPDPDLSVSAIIPVRPCFLFCESQKLLTEATVETFLYFYSP